MAKIKDTPFSSGVKDSLASVDVYKENSKQAINKRNKVKDKVNYLNDKKDVIDNLINDRKNIPKYLAMFGAKGLNSLLNKTGLSAKLIKLLNSKTAKRIGGLLTTVAAVKIFYNKIKSKKKKKVKINGSYRSLSDTQYNDWYMANGVYKDILIKNIAERDYQTAVTNGDITTSPNATTFKDLDTESALYVTAITGFLRLNDTESILKVLAEITDLDLKRLVLELVLGPATKTIDLDLLALIINELGIVKILSLNPNIVENILSNYSFPPGTKPSDYPAIKAKLVNILDRLDVNWYLIRRDGVWVRNMRPFIVMSDAVLLLFISDSLHRAACIISNSYRTESIIDIIKRQYPLTTF